jgi:hypothetical protein
MTLTERAADVRRRLDEIEATASRGKWDRRKEHLIRACFAHAAALAGERAKTEVYIDKGLAWCHANAKSPRFAAMDQKVADAINAHIAACHVLRDTLRILTPIEGAEMPATWNPGIDWGKEDAA